jgi:hypothetical protein
VAEFLSTKDASQVLKLTVLTLARYRCSGFGPPFMKIGGKILYERGVIETWALNRKRSSTSDISKG